LSLAPELAFPERLIRQMTQVIEEMKTKAQAAELLAGWRERLLRQPFLAAAQR